ncbi:hypothetical protein SNOG_07436 [Parastagonospora nodorum SN15]|uniref:Uncharacterized protein n=1 Tax=Phaeosphaeria nodorum (strain SN15 / ATCC MYA-4574 / FGSC 10173) TaxID=321614 RepID=Q0ULC8_PHANO|nr:hypothetical protein SNOG_07436 [Parastagonospora nodorum SN15]EAT84902.1 hypothetical protein SNOG_07436 [Parastagonospora nodorum SN15]
MCEGFRDPSHVTPYILKQSSIAVIADHEHKAQGLVLGALVAESHICGRE